MARTASIIDALGLDKSNLSSLRQQARTLGLKPDLYAKQLIEEGIHLEQRARTHSFDELFAPIQERFQRSGMTEQTLDKLVEVARKRRHPRARARKRSV